MFGQFYGILYFLIILTYLRCDTSRTVPESIPGGVTAFYSDISPSDRAMALGIKAAGAWGWQPHHLRVPNVMKSGSLNLLEPSRPHRACYGTALPFHLLTYSMVQSPSWEANRFAASQEIPRILWNPKIHYRTHKFPPPVPILNHLHPVHTPTSHFLKIHLNIILPCMPWSHKWSLSLRFSQKNPVYPFPLPHTRYMPSPSHASRFYHRCNIGWGIEIIKLIIKYLSPFPRYVVRLRPKYSPQHPIFKQPQHIV
jgi:hypothetical protein